MSKDESTLCKGFAILIMLFHHLFYNLNNWQSYNVKSFIFSSEEELNSFAVSMKICVAIFVFLSGYGITKSIDTNMDIKKYSRYLYRRFVKLYTHFWYIYFCVFGFVFTYDCGKTVFDKYFSDGNIVAIKNIFIDFIGLSRLLKTPSLRGTWWYMSLAVCIIVVTPLFVILIKKLGYLLSIFLVILPYFLPVDMDYMLWFYMPSLILGILAAQYKYFEKLKRIENSKSNQIILLVVYAVLLIMLTNYRIKMYPIPILEAFSAMLVCFIAVTAVRLCPSVSMIIMPIGIREYTIFLTHTILRDYFPSILYIWHNPLMIWIVFIVLSLCLAILLDRIEELLKIKNMTKHLLRHNS